MNTSPKHLSQRHGDTETQRPQDAEITGPEIDTVTETIIGCAIEVHRALGPGLRERSYENAICIEFEDRRIQYERQMRFSVSYKGHFVGSHGIDLIVADLVIVEIKAVEQMHPVFEAQLLTYLRVAKKRVGLLLNFNSRLMKDGITRKIL